MIFKIAVIKPDYSLIIIYFYPMVRAQQSPKQRRISRSVLLLLLRLGKATSFRVYGSVYMKYIVLHRLIMREFFNYSATLSVWPLQRCTVLRSEIAAGGCWWTAEHAAQWFRNTRAPSWMPGFYWIHGSCCGTQHNRHGHATLAYAPRHAT